MESNGWYLLPEHSAGPVRLEVACNGSVISQAVIFEYKCNGSSGDDRKDDDDDAEAQTTAMAMAVVGKLEVLSYRIEANVFREKVCAFCELANEHLVTLR